MKTKRIAHWLGLILLLALLILWSVTKSPTDEVDRMLLHAKLGRLPPSATNVTWHQWNRFFAGETYARFELSPGDLRALIADSPALQFARPEDIFSSSHQHLPNAADSSRVATGHAYYQRHPMFPDWFQPTITGNGRKYFLWPDKWLLLDEDRNTVWLHFVKG